MAKGVSNLRVAASMPRLAAGLAMGEAAGLWARTEGWARMLVWMRVTGVLRVLPAVVGASALLLGLTGCAGFFVDGHTSTVLTSSAASAAYGASVTLTAKLSTTAATGTVTFYDSGTSLGTGTVASGKASLATSTLTVGSHTLTADYGGDTNYQASDSDDVTVVVSTSLTTTTTTLAASANAITYGSAVVFTGVVSTTAASGTVSYYDGSTLLGTATVSTGTTAFSTSALAVGTHTIVAIYSGDSTYATSTSSAVSVVVSAKS